MSGKGVAVRHVFQFEVGERYENRKGTYEVLEIAGDDMRIRWDAGDEVATSVAMQHRIINHMQQESEPVPVSKSASARKKTSSSHIWHRS